MTTMWTGREFGLTAAGVLGASAARRPAARAEARPAGPLYFDLHIDTPARLLDEGLDLAESPACTHVDIPGMRQGGLTAGFFAVSTPARSQTPLSAVKNAPRLVDVIVEEVGRHPSDTAEPPPSTTSGANEVPRAGIEPARPEGSRDFKSRASASFATSAWASRATCSVRFAVLDTAPPSGPTRAPGERWLRS